MFLIAENIYPLISGYRTLDCFSNYRLFRVSRRIFWLFHEIFLLTENILLFIGWLVGCRVKVNCPFVRSGPVGEVPSVGVLLRDPSSYLREFWRKPRKTPNG